MRRGRATCTPRAGQVVMISRWRRRTVCRHGSAPAAPPRTRTAAHPSSEVRLRRNRQSATCQPVQLPLMKHHAGTPPNQLYKPGGYALSAECHSPGIQSVYGSPASRRSSSSAGTSACSSMRSAMVYNSATSNRALRFAAAARSSAAMNRRPSACRESFQGEKMFSDSMTPCALYHCMSPCLVL